MNGLGLEREGIVASIGQLLDEARAGAGSFLFLIGEAGLGKTAALRHACRLAAPDMRLAVGGGDVRESSLPFGLLTQPLSALGHAFPGEPAGAGWSDPDRRAWRFHAVLRLLREAASTPVLVALDDLHWADRESLDLLSFLCRRLRDVPVAVLATLRSWPPAARAMALALAESGTARLERLAPLSTEAGRSLLLRLTGRPLGEGPVQRVTHLCGGNPLLLERLAMAMRNGAHPPELVDEWSPGVVGDQLIARFAALPAIAMLFAGAASVFGTRFPTRLVSTVAGLDDAEGDAALEALERSGLISETLHGQAEFIPPLFGRALYSDLPSSTRMRLHARAFHALIGRGVDSEAAAHALHGLPPGSVEAVATLERAGISALRHGAGAQGMRYLAAAADIAGGSAQPGLLVALGDALVDAGRSTQAIPVYERLLAAQNGDVRGRIDTACRLGRAHALNGTLDRAVERFEEAEALAAADAPTAVAEVLVDHADVVGALVGPVHSLPLVRRARALADRAGEPVRGRVDALCGATALLLGDPSDVDDVDAAADAAERTAFAQLPDRSWTRETLLSFALVAICTERYGDAERALTLVLRNAERSGALQGVWRGASLLAHVLLLTGRLEEALGTASHAAAVADAQPVATAHAGAALATVLLHLGRVEEATAWCDRAERPATTHRQWLPLLRLWHVRGECRLRAGEPEEASAVYSRLRVVSDRVGVGEPCLVPWARVGASAHCATGREGEARQVLTGLERRHPRLPCRWPAIAAATVRARLAERMGDATTADDRYRVALRLHAGLTLPLEHIRTLLDYGAFLRRVGGRTEARARLTEALRIVDATGAAWLVGDVERELAVAGGRRRRSAEPVRLTAQEQRVAELAAVGCTNREIGARLSLSAGTVDSHLKRIYPKLGIHSRRRLMSMAGAFRRPLDGGQEP